MRTFLVPALLLMACGPRHIRVDTDQGQAAEAQAALPPIRDPKMIWGDGFGRTEREANAAARDVVLLEIADRIKLSPAHAFRHPEMIRNRGLVPRPGGFMARVGLDTRQAIAAHRQELATTREAITTTTPLVRSALESLDTAVLLNATYDLGDLVAEQRRLTSILELLGESVEPSSTDDALALQRRVEQRRAPTYLRGRLDSAARGPIQRAVLNSLAEVLVAKGCRITEGQPNPPFADAKVMVSLRDHDERGLLWRYVSAQMEIVDPRSHGTVLSYSAPTLAHGGGNSWERADQSVIRRIGEVLSEPPAAFQALRCK